MKRDSKEINDQMLKFLNNKFKSHPNHFEYLESKHLLRIYVICMDIGRYEEALECCGKLLKLNPEFPEAKTLLQIQENLKKKTTPAKNYEKKGPCGTIVNPPKVTPKTSNKNKGKNSKKKHKKPHDPVANLKLNIPKECSDNYTPNSRYQLSCDEGITRKYGLW